VRLRPALVGGALGLTACGAGGTVTKPAVVVTLTDVGLSSDSFPVATAGLYTVSALVSAPTLPSPVRCGSSAVEVSLSSDNISVRSLKLTLEAPPGRSSDKQVYLQAGNWTVTIHRDASGDRGNGLCTSTVRATSP
jgi:hypothetical protein